MGIVLLTALGVGGATVIGALAGFLFRNVSHRVRDIILAFAAGIMLAAAVIGLILPSLELGGEFSIIVTVVGILLGAVALSLLDKLVPHLHLLAGTDIEGRNASAEQNKILLFVLAIAIHNLPEGIAAGVGFGGADVTNDMTNAFLIAGGIALQNIPEGMVIIAPMLATGMSKRRTFLIATMTGVVEVIGTLFGYYAVHLAEVILPFSLAFAGGTMLYVISDEMIPETHAHGAERGATYALLIGFCLMLVFDFIL